MSCIKYTADFVTILYELFPLDVLVVILCPHHNIITSYALVTTPSD